MIKRAVTAAALAFLLAGGALAQAPAPAEAPVTQAPQSGGGDAAETVGSAEACMDAAATLGTSAEGKTFTDDKLDRLDQLFSKMETLCDGRQFTEAMAIARDIKTVLDGN